MTANFYSLLRIRNAKLKAYVAGGVLIARSRVVWVSLLPFALLAASSSQTFKVDPSAPQKTQSEPKADSSSDSEQKLGWGSNIQNARLAHAAEIALKEGKYQAATEYATRAVKASPNEPQLWFLLGYAARLSGRPRAAVDAYEHGLKLKPSSLEGQSGLAQTYNVVGRRQEAQDLLIKILAGDPKRINDQVLLGEIYLRSGEYEKAIQQLNHTEQFQPSARSELLIASSYQHLKQPAQATRYLEMARRRAPDNPEVQRAVAGYYRDNGDYAQAIALLKGIAGKNPDVIAELAYTYQLYGKPDEAARLYVQAANLAPRDLNLQLSAAQAQVGSGAVEKAEPFIKRATTIEAENYRLHAILGEIARIQDRNEDAVREYNAALAHLPEAPPEGPLYGVQLHLNLMEVYRSSQNDEASKRELETARSQISALDVVGPARAEFLRLRAMIKMNGADFDGAAADLKEALSINDKDPHTLQLEGDLLVKQNHLEEATAAYQKVLAIDPQSQSALIALGYVSRQTGHDLEAEKYFQKLEAAYPKLYVPYLALGDMYAANRDFPKAEASYRKAIEMAPKNPLIVAGGMNAAIEAHHFPLAAEWLARADTGMQREPHLMREKERYLNFIGDFKQSEEVGKLAIEQLPKDRDVAVYLGYDMLRLEQYDDLLQLTSQYEDVLPKEPDIPLLAGYAHKHFGKLEEANQDFTNVIDRDPKVVTAYVNRGYVLKDLHQPVPAIADFETALRMEPRNGEAHLGLAYASLDAHKPHIALKQVALAEKEMGDSLPIHLIKATAYGAEGMFAKAIVEYRIALKSAPNEPNLHAALGNSYFGLRRYREAISELQVAERLSTDKGPLDAQIARAYAHLDEREQTMKYIALAEKEGPDIVFLSTGEALSILGDRVAAMDRFERALDAPGDRMGVRLAIARLMATDGRWDDARRQMALGLMEVHAQKAEPPTGGELVEVADTFLAMHDFELAQLYFERALAAGGSEMMVRIGLANTYLEQGDTVRAQAQIAAIGTQAEGDPSYDYLLAKANVLRQQHHNTQALTAFAEAANAAGEDRTADQDLLQAGASEGLRINQKVSVLSDFSVAPIFEDTTVYVLDSKLDVTSPLPGQQNLLPLPRSSLETQWTGAYHLHLNHVPDLSGFFQMRNDRGQISLPSAGTIINRNTTDYSFNIGVNPTLHLGRNVFSFNTGIQETIRRDSRDPIDQNQNLSRQFLYMSTSSFFNTVSVSGYAIHESGPFTERNLHSRDLSAAVDFRVGRPWGKTALITGWGARDIQFTPLIREFYFTSAYLGVQHKFSNRLSFSAIAEDLRAWRVQDARYALAQALRPSGTIEYSPTRNWAVQGNLSYSRNMSFHAYDALQGGFAVSYARPFGRVFKDDSGQVLLRYPIRFSAGVQQETFFHFTGGHNHLFRPYLRISLF